MSPAAQEKRRKEAADLRAKGGSGAEQNACHLEAMQHRWEEDARKDAESAEKNPKYLTDLQAYRDAQTKLATLDADGRHAPACVMAEKHSTPADWRLVPLGTAGCRAVIHKNYSLFHHKLPRSALQILYIENITQSTVALQEEKYLRENPGNCVGITTLLRQTDWQQLAGLLEK